MEAFSICPLPLACFDQHGVFKVHPCWSRISHLFKGWILFPCMSTPHFIYPFIYCWTFGRCEQRGYEHGCANTRLSPCFHFFAGYTQKWNGGIAW